MNFAVGGKGPYFEAEMRACFIPRAVYFYGLAVIAYCLALRCIVLYCVVLYCIVMYSIVFYCVALYCDVLCCIVL